MWDGIGRAVTCWRHCAVHGQGFAHTRILVCPLKDWAPTQARGLKYTAPWTPSAEGAASEFFPYCAESSFSVWMGFDVAQQYSRLDSLAYGMSQACFSERLVAEHILFGDPTATLTKVVFDGCQTSRNALEVLSSFTTEEVQPQSV